jgi:RNA polymerase sigma-70 factor (ECF subfamily)
VKKWRFSFGAVEGRPVMPVFDGDAAGQPSHFVVVDWRGEQIVRIRDFLYAPYALDDVDWVKLAWTSWS